MPAHDHHYVGRFAPSPTGPLHAGSLVAALASWLDARAHGGHWLVRIEDIDAPRCTPGAAELILHQLAACGLVADAPPLWQHTRGGAYAAAMQTLLDRRLAYACGCTRKEVDDVAQARGRPRFGARIYPGTCRDGLHGKTARAVRVLTRTDGGDVLIDWLDRRLGAQQQNLAQEVGDFILKRADGLWAYQLAVVVDDAALGISHVVRGADLADNTPRQMWLQQLLGLRTPQYLHTALVLGADGHKLSKQNGAMALDLSSAVATLQAAAAVLELPTLPATTREEWLAQAVSAWAARWVA